MRIWSIATPISIFGLQEIDIRTTESPHWVRNSGLAKELYDVVALPGAVRSMAIGFTSDEIRQMLRWDKSDYL